MEEGRVDEEGMRKRRMETVEGRRIEGRGMRRVDGRGEDRWVTYLVGQKSM